MSVIKVPPRPKLYTTSNGLGYWFGIITANRRKLMIWLPATNWDHVLGLPRPEIDCPFQKLAEANGWRVRWDSTKYIKQRAAKVEQLMQPGAAEAEAKRLAPTIVPYWEWDRANPETWRAEVSLINGAGI